MRITVAIGVTIPTTQPVYNGPQARECVENLIQSLRPGAFVGSCRLPSVIPFGDHLSPIGLPCENSLVARPADIQFLALSGQLPFSAMEAAPGRRRRDVNYASAPRAARGSAARRDSFAPGTTP